MVDQATGTRTNLFDPEYERAAREYASSHTLNVPELSACFSGNGKRLALYSDYSVRIWDVSTGKFVWKYVAAARSNGFSAPTLNYAGDKVASSSHIWDVTSRKVVQLPELYTNYHDQDSGKPIKESDDIRFATWIGDMILAYPANYAHYDFALYSLTPSLHLGKKIKGRPFKEHGAWARH